MRRSRLVGGLAAVAALAVGGAVSAPVAGSAPVADGQRTETPVVSSSPVSEVVESVVSVRVPLPDSVGPHPEACDRLSYLRWRHADGPADSASADRVLVAQPGVIEGAGAFDSVARNTVVEAAELGRHVEFWALDRRSNCLEDNTGRMAGLAARDHQVAIDYYYRGGAVDGRTFAGFQTNEQVGWLGEVGIAQTVRDQYDLIRHELPDPAQRREKLFCGGHSLGGLITGYFATWDFDGDAATTDDAGHNQCAGWFALDSTIRTALPAATADRMLPAAEDPSAPILSLPAVINPETMSLLGLAGLAALTDPHGTSDLINFATGVPAAKDFNLSNQTAMAALLDNNSQPLAFLQASVGFFDGGKIADKEFPLAHELGDLPLLGELRNLLGLDRKAIPTDAGFPLGTGPTYTWRNYDRIDAPDDPRHRARDGRPFTSAAKEVTDVGQLARSLAEAPLDFTEWYFPARLSEEARDPTAEIARHTLHPGGITARPVITLLAGAGYDRPQEPDQPAPVLAPGYHHLDVLTAAAAQNGGRQEPVSVNLARFVTIG
ncbi:hypothetical protein [Actinokineospora pegani]|uniref:hypothetical protein n=1 Tax=Actinokineospora pegani TaxID=2654637 RepID=UPI001F3647CE|nr:hypothetical protein [Actinokineospora pegani]